MNALIDLLDLLKTALVDWLRLFKVGRWDVVIPVCNFLVSISAIGTMVGLYLRVRRLSQEMDGFGAGMQQRYERFYWDILRMLKVSLDRNAALLERDREHRSGRAEMSEEEREGQAGGLSPPSVPSKESSEEPSESIDDLVGDAFTQITKGDSESPLTSNEKEILNVLGQPRYLEEILKRSGIPDWIVTFSLQRLLRNGLISAPKDAQGVTQYVRK